MTTTTIRQALAAFLADTRARVSVSTARRYEFGIDLFEESMDGYGLLGDRDDSRLFCDATGAGRIPGEVDEFFSWYLVRKVSAPMDDLKACGTAVKQLATWLGERGHLDQVAAKSMKAAAAQGARAFVRSQELREVLEELSQVHTDEKTEEGHFDIKRIEDCALIISPMHGGELRLVLPEWALELSEPGWTFSGVVGQQGDDYELVEIWNVYP